jgi:hypothetical protein
MTSQKTDRPSEHELSRAQIGLNQSGSGCNEVQEREIQTASRSRWR